MINWLKTNLLFFAQVVGMFLLIFFGGGSVDFLATLVPENIAATFPFIPATGVILYLIGLGFYWVEKNTKN